MSCVFSSTSPKPTHRVVLVHVGVKLGDQHVASVQILDVSRKPGSCRREETQGECFGRRRDANASPPSPLSSGTERRSATTLLREVMKTSRSELCTSHFTKKSRSDTAALGFLPGRLSTWRSLTSKVCRGSRFNFIHPSCLFTAAHKIKGRNKNR